MTGARTNSDRDRVRDASDIVRVIGEHVALKSKGREFVGLCPFHDDHRPSMYVVPAKQIFHCFVCGAGGDVFGFVKRFHKLEFREAIEYLARRANITLAEPAAAASASRSTIAGANAAASDFFSQVLRHASHGQEARAMIERRGIAPEMVSRFALGATPNRWDGLLLWLRQRGLDDEPFLSAGLLKRHAERGSLYDSFRNRLMFPIHDLAGRVIAFGARRLDEADEPKYLNSPEHALFDKSSTLFALHQASRAIQGERTAVITEGYTDAIACHQAGIENVVATLGTALTRGHASVLRRLCDSVVLLFDGDDAGRRAADRAFEVFFSESIDVRIASLGARTDAKDPDELLKRPGGVDVLKSVIADAPDLLDHRFRRLAASWRGLGAAGFARAVEGEVDRLISLGLDRASPALRATVVRRLGDMIGAEPGSGADAAWATIRERIARAARRTPESAAEAPRAMSALEHALGCLLCAPSLLDAVEPEDRALIAPDRYSSAPMRAVAQAVHEVRSDRSSAESSPDLAHVLDLLDEDEPRRLAAGLAARVGAETEHDADRLTAHLRACVRRLALERPHAGESRSNDASEPSPGTATGSDQSSPTASATLAERLQAERDRRQRYGSNLGVLPRTR